MKTISMIILLMPFWALNSFGQSADATGLLDNPETRTEIFKSILNDHELMTEFMKEIKKNDHAMMMMKDKPEMMNQEEEVSSAVGEGHQMMGMNNDNSKEDHMLKMMKDKPEMMEMMSKMMEMSEQDSTMSNKMADMMTEHTRMMQMCMQKMKEKGMMGTDGKMKMMDTENNPENKEHNHKH